MAATHVDLTDVEIEILCDESLKNLNHEIHALTKRALRELQRRRAQDGARTFADIGEHPFPEYGDASRQRELAIMIASGLTRSAILEKVDYCAKTYDTHRQHVMKRAGVSGDVALTRLAIRMGYVSCECPASVEKSRKHEEALEREELMTRSGTTQLFKRATP